MDVKIKLQQDESFLRKALIDAGAVFRHEGSSNFRCPFHNDRNPSARIFRGDNGIYLFKCYACDAKGDVFTVLAKTENCRTGEVIARYVKSDRQEEKVMSNNIDQKDKQETNKIYSSIDSVCSCFRNLGFDIESMHHYQNPSKIDQEMYVFRLLDSKGVKSFRQVMPKNSGFVLKGLSKDIPLYNAKALLESELVIVCEGEKAADALTGIGLIATTSAGGSNGSDKSDWTILAGKTVYIWPDYDDPGIDYANSVAWTCDGMIPEPKIRILDPEVLDLDNPGDDAFDYVQICKKNGLDDCLIRENILSTFLQTEMYKPCGNNIITDEKPFPTECLPGKAKETIECIAESIGCDESMPALALLCAASAAIGNTRQLQIKEGWYEPAAIWGALVAGSSVGKSPALNSILQPLYDLENLILNQLYQDLFDLQSSGCLDDEFSKPPYSQRLIVSDITVEALASKLSENPHGLLLHRDELAGWFNSFNKYKSGGDDKQNWLSIWRAGQITVDRKTSDKPAMSVEKSFVSVVGTIQPEVLASSLKGENSYNGMAARFLYAVPESKRTSWTESGVPQNLIEDLKRVYLSLLKRGWKCAGKITPETVKFSPEASCLFGRYHNKSKDEALKHGGMLESILGKADSYAGRIALILHELKCVYGLQTGNIVSEDTLAEAIRICSWFMDQAYKVNNLTMVSDNKALFKDIRWIQNHGCQVSVREWVHHKSMNYKSAMALKFFDQLEKAGIGRVRNHVKKGRGKKPGPVFFLYG